MKAIITGNKGDGRKRSTIANLHRYSDLSIEAIAQQVDMEPKRVLEIVDDLVKNEGLEVLVDQSTTPVEKIMTPVVISLDCSERVRNAAALMAEKEIGSIVVTKGSKPFGIVTHSDIARWAGLRPALLDSTLEGVASVPLIYAERGTTVEEAAMVMIKNRIHKLPVVDNQGVLLGIVTITDLAVFLSPSRRSGLALSVLQAMSRGKPPQ